MAHKILVLNSGSSSVKYSLFAMEQGGRVIAKGQIERIGEAASAVTDHADAIDTMVLRLRDEGLLDEGELRAVGHRVVHGGEDFSEAVLIDATVIEAIQAAIPLAPLHNPANLTGILACRERWPTVPQVAVFDTAFHQTLPPEAYRYAIPESAYRDFKVRRYGFHGTSYAYVTRRVAEHLAQPQQALNLIILHLGNGASVCAVRAGRSVDTSMGMTPLAGLMMGTRCGDLDPGVIFYLLNEAGMTPAELDGCLNRNSGLKAIAGSNDMRDVLSQAAAGKSAALLAKAMVVHRIRHYIGAYVALLGRVDALVFTGGIGEHAAEIRAEACCDLAGLGIVLDTAANQAATDQVLEIQSAVSTVRILVVATDEEQEIARQTSACVATGYPTII
ncbi:MAG: acetate/propionate family kinase [Methylococcaceae bacterium]|jgi:acetate kinase